MIWLAATCVLLAGMVGVLLTAVTLPGIWFMIGVALACQWWQGLFSWWTLGAAVALGLMAEAVELFASAAGSGRAGGSRHGAWGSIAGSLIGLIVGQLVIPIPILGALIGAVGGAGLGAILTERGVAKRTWGESYRSGRGAATGRLVSAVVKTAFAIVVAIMLTVDAYWN